MISFSSASSVKSGSPRQTLCSVGSIQTLSCMHRRFAYDRELPLLPGLASSPGVHCRINPTEQASYLPSRLFLLFSLMVLSTLFIEVRLHRREWRMPLKAVSFASIRDWIIYERKRYRLFPCSILFLLTFQPGTFFSFCSFFSSSCHVAMTLALRLKGQSALPSVIKASATMLLYFLYKGN